MTGANLDHEEHVQAAQGDRAVHVKEVARQYRGRLRPQELPPGRSAALRRGRDPQPFEHPPNRRGSDPEAQAEQLALDPPVTPARVLPGHLLNQHCDPRIHGRPAAAAGIGPAPADQPPVPAQQRVRRDQPAHPQWPGEKPGQRGEHCPVGPIQLRLGILPLQHRHLLAQHQQLGVLGSCRAREQHHPASHADEEQVQNPYSHKPVMLPAAGSLAQANLQVSHLRPVLEPHRQQGQPSAQPDEDQIEQTK